jgi:hypothetical protein
MDISDGPEIWSGIKARHPAPSKPISSVHGVPLTIVTLAVDALFSIKYLHCFQLTVCIVFNSSRPARSPRQIQIGKTSGLKD